MMSDSPWYHPKLRSTAVSYAKSSTTVSALILLTLFLGASSNTVGSQPQMVTAAMGLVFVVSLAAFNLQHLRHYNFDEPDPPPLTDYQVAYESLRIFVSELNLPDDELLFWNGLEPQTWILLKRVKSNGCIYIRVGTDVSMHTEEAVEGYDYSEVTVYIVRPTGNTMLYRYSETRDLDAWPVDDPGGNIDMCISLGGVGNLIASEDEITELLALLMSQRPS